MDTKTRTHLKVFAIDVLQAVIPEKPKDHPEHPLWVRREATVAVCPEALDQVGDDVVEAWRIDQRGLVGVQNGGGKI